jgi:hypothetical protein
MIVDNCWKCGGPAAPEKIVINAEVLTRVRCHGLKCHAAGLAATDARMAVKLWNDEQRDRRQVMTDTELLNGPPGAPTDDKFRDDAG